MLAAPTKEEDLRAMKYPKLLSAKIDGVRALCIRNAEGKPELVSRKLLKIPNLHVQRLFAREEFIGLDGELAVGPATAKNLMQATTSGVMTAEGEPDVRWYIFDKFGLDKPYAHRAVAAKWCCGTPIDGSYDTKVIWLSQIPVHSYDEMIAMEDGYLEQGFEGAILRCPHAPYKEGRSTVRQGWMLKLKRFADGEAEVIGTIEQMRNDNEATTDETGYTKRSSHKAGKTNAGILGAIQVRDIKTGVEFEIGTGFTFEQRTNLWASKQYLIGKLVKYKHFPIGVKDKPRHPVFVAWRDRRDM
jgi:DNA ligase-1